VKEKIRQRAWLPWLGVGLLTVLCGVLAFLQYRWIGEVAGAEKSRLHEDLQSRLNLLRRNFDDQIGNSCYAFVPPNSAIEKLGREEAYLEQYRRAVESHGQVIARVALAVPRGESVDLLMVDTNLGRFVPADWPADWRGMQGHVSSRWRGGPFDTHGTENTALVELPRFGVESSSEVRSGRLGELPRMREQEWLILQLNLAYIRDTILPGMIQRYLGDSGKLDYDAKVVVSGSPWEEIYQTPGSDRITAADAAVTLLDIRRGMPIPQPRDSGTPPSRRLTMLPPPNRGEPRMAPPPRNVPAPSRMQAILVVGQPGDPGRGAWLLTVHHHAGSLEAIVAQARRRNIALSGGILLLILAAVVLLMRLSRQQQQVAEIQMNFVAGVSHELRTPLTVIRTAAYNLRGKLAQSPDHVERYGKLIQDESEKLGALVEQVLRYGNTNAGRVIQERTPVAVGELIEDSLRSSQAAIEGAGVVIEKRVAPDLPMVLADAVAMKHAIQNLLDNALKYGTDGNHWIGVFASVDTGGPAVEIRVADRGKGIPREERQHIFDPFYRGRSATRDQVHGTGLGLNLVKKIVEAHGGAIQVTSEPEQGTEFIIRIPAAPPEIQNELAHSLS